MSLELRPDFGGIVYVEDPDEDQEFHVALKSALDGTIFAGVYLTPSEAMTLGIHLINTAHAEMEKE